MSASSVRGRYAPSPSGALHLGNVRTALLAWLFARASAGAFILRIEDLDHPRTRPNAASSLLRDLRWLGLDWDEGPEVRGAHGPYYQSQRTALYDAALAQLRATQRIYPCYCTRADLARIASAPHPGDEGVVYPGTCRRLSAVERQRRERAGCRYSWRFLVPDEEVVFYDALAAEVRDSPASAVGDFIVRRSDGVYAYQLAVVVDDALMGVTQIVRGADLLASTARQLTLYDALGYPRPQYYAHVPVLTDASGARLSKRDAATGLDPLRAAGCDPREIICWLAASCGVTPSAQPTSPYELVPAFSPDAIRDGGALAPLKHKPASHA